MPCCLHVAFGVGVDVVYEGAAIFTGAVNCDEAISLPQWAKDQCAGLAPDSVIKHLMWMTVTTKEAFLGTGGQACGFSGAPVNATDPLGLLQDEMSVGVYFNEEDSVIAVLDFTRIYTERALDILPFPRFPFAYGPYSYGEYTRTGGSSGNISAGGDDSLNLRFLVKESGVYRGTFNCFGDLVGTTHGTFTLEKSPHPPICELKDTAPLVQCLPVEEG